MPLLQTDKPIYYIRRDTLVWPVTESEIREANPNVSFPDPFVPLSEYACVLPKQKPEHNPVTHTAAEGDPVLTDKGHWEQTWVLTPIYATTEEESAAIAADSEAKRRASIPESVSPRQIRQALTRAGLRASVDAAVAAGDQDTKDWYEFATSFDRSNPVVAALGALLNVSDAQLDDLWILAASL